jgi:nucleoside-diphosphate-sugar epimerase
MRVFLTGATGWIGSAILPELLKGGHTVLGLARSDESAAKLKSLGVDVQRGDITDLDSMVAGAKACDGVIHTAFIHDWSDFMGNVAKDLAAVSAMIAAIEGTGKPFVNSSGTMMVQHAKPATEKDESPNPDGPRIASSHAVLTAKGVRGSVVRLPPTTHGAGDHGFMARLVDIARTKGFAAYVGDGANRWPAGHRFDAARLYVLALEKAAPGTNLHAVAEEGVSMRSIAETIGAGLGVPVRGLTQEEAPAYFDFLAMFIGVDNPTSSAITRATLGWSPRELALLPDIRDNYCRAEATVSKYS